MRLPYRSLRFVHTTPDVTRHQPVAAVNYPQTEAHTRITESKHLTGQEHVLTSLTFEYSSAEGDPYYPIPRPENQALFKRCERLALTERNVWFVGRLATDRYYNMDQIVGQALATFRRIDAQLGHPASGSVRIKLRPSATIRSLKSRTADRQGGNRATPARSSGVQERPEPKPGRACSPVARPAQKARLRAGCGLP
ncbi:hypothetical protein JOE48_002455 [Methylobacterium sp. PvR107]|nr:hypothetical protein [Methylobacterium sp. PvR107]